MTNEALSSNVHEWVNPWGDKESAIATRKVKLAIQKLKDDFRKEVRNIPPEFNKEKMLNQVDIIMWSLIDKIFGDALTNSPDDLSRKSDDPDKRNIHRTKPGDNSKRNTSEPSGLYGEIGCINFYECGKCHTEQKMKLSIHGKKPSDTALYCPNCDDLIEPSICKKTTDNQENQGSSCAKCGESSDSDFWCKSCLWEQSQAKTTDNPDGCGKDFEHEVYDESICGQLTDFWDEEAETSREGYVLCPSCNKEVYDTYINSKSKKRMHLINPKIVDDSYVTTKREYCPGGRHNPEVCPYTGKEGYVKEEDCHCFLLWYS